MSSSVRPAPGSQSQSVDGAALVLNPPATELVRLNPVGTLVWEHLVRWHTVEELIASVRPSFPEVPFDQLAGDVIAFVESLCDAGVALCEE